MTEQEPECVQWASVLVQFVVLVIIGGIALLVL